MCRVPFAPTTGRASSLVLALLLPAFLGACGASQGPRCPRPDPGPPLAPGGRGVPATVELQSTPRIPKALRARLARYAGARAATLTALAEDGRSLLVTTRFGQTHQLHRVTTPGGRREQLTFRNEPVSSAKLVPGDPASVVFRADRGGSERYQLFRLDLASRTTTLLTDGRSRHGGYLVSPDGRRILYTGNGRNGRDMDLYLADLHAPAAGRAAARRAAPFLPRQGTWFPLDWSRDGGRVLLLEYRSINDARLHLLDLASRRVTRLSPADRAASYRTARFAPDGRRVYATSDRDGDFVALYEVDPATSTWTPLTADLRWNVEGLAVSPDGRAVVFGVNEGGWTTLRRLDPATRRHAPLPGVPRGLVSGLRFARRAPVLGFTLRGPTLAGDAYTLDLRPAVGGAPARPVRWTVSELGGLDPRHLARPRLIHYPTFDTRRIPAFYYRPPTRPSAGEARPSPVVIWIHGGPESQARPTLNPLVQYLVRESRFAVLQPNVRGSDGYGKAYLQLDNGRRREDSVRDIGALLDWIARQPELDARRVAVLGGSYGGYMVLASLVHYGSRLRAGIDVVGISNFVTFLRNTKAYRRNLRRAEYGDERDPTMRAFLEGIAPTRHAHRIRSALFVAQGANDPRVPLSESEQILRAVRAQGQEVWSMVARNEGHGFRKQQNRSLFFALSVLFLEKHLAPTR